MMASEKSWQKRISVILSVVAVQESASKQGH